jgi:acid phosphatase (class A)
LHFLTRGQLDPAEVLSPPPLAGSEEQAVDLAAVVAIHGACDRKQAAIAAAEKTYSIFSFSDAIGSSLQPGRLPKTEAFFGRVNADADIATEQAKECWKRPRPYTVDTNLGSGKLEKSYGYPSGHSTEATVMALVLAELFPARREEILAVSRNIGWHRVWIARHYPTDIYAGRVYARAIVHEMKSNPAFRRDLAEAKSEIGGMK